MTPPEFESLWTPELHDQLKMIAGHHYALLQRSAKRVVDFDDLFQEALLGVIDAAISNFDTGDFAHFCKFAMRKQCLAIRAFWRKKKRDAILVSDHSFETDAWVPRSREDDVYPEDEQEWTLAITKERGLTPLSTDERCWHCQDAARTLYGGAKSKEGGQIRTCYDDRCEALKRAERASRYYRRNRDAVLSRRRAAPVLASG